MAKNSFYNGECIRYEVDARVTINGKQGFIWVYRRKCPDDSGWLHMGKQFNQMNATRKQIADSFGHDYK